MEVHNTGGKSLQTGCCTDLCGEKESGRKQSTELLIMIEMMWRITNHLKEESTVIKYTPNVSYIQTRLCNCLNLWDICRVATV